MITLLLLLLQIQIKVLTCCLVTLQKQIEILFYLNKLDLKVLPSLSYCNDHNSVTIQNQVYQKGYTISRSPKNWLLPTSNSNCLWIMISVSKIKMLCPSLWQGHGNPHMNFKICKSSWSLKNTKSKISQCNFVM